MIYLLALVAALLLAPGFAFGSTAKITFANVKYDAVAGETNQLTVQRQGSNYVFTESGAVAIAAAAPCVNILASVAACPVAGIQQIDVALGDMNDSASFDASVVGSLDDVELDGGVGNDTLAGAGPTDGYLLGREGNDVITGSDGDDDVRAGEGNDTVNTGTGDDYVDEGSGADTVNTGSGNDRIRGSITADNGDVLDGGAGLGDSIDLRDRTAPLNISFNGVADDGEAGEGDNLIGIERVDSGEGDDTLTGGPAPEQLFSNDGHDVIDGGPGPDELGGGQGNDVVRGGSGNDNLDGGDGADQLDGGEGDDDFYGGFFDSGADSMAGGEGIDSIIVGGDFLGRGVTIDLDGVADDGPTVPVDEVPLDNAGADIENLLPFEEGEGNLVRSGDDILTGNDSPNQIDGGPGDDQIMGLGGPDELIGGPGDDDLDGGNGVDGIEGQGGSDSIRSRDNAADEVGCGSATDTLLADSLDVFSVTCDQSSTGAELKSGNVKLSKKGKAKVKVACPVAEGIDCQVKITANKGKKTVAKGSGKVKTGKTGKITLKLTKKGKRQKGKKIKGQASTQLTDATGAKVTTSRKLVLKR